MSRKEYKNPLFLGLYCDSTFKLLFKSEFKWFYRDIIIEYTGIDIDNYEFFDNEINMGKKHNKDDFRLDMLLKEKNSDKYLDIELNTYDCRRRNEIYLHSLAVVLYNMIPKKERRKRQIDVRQINFNLVGNSKEAMYSHIALKNQNNKMVTENFQIYNYNLYISKNKSYNYDNKFKLLVCTSYEEMKNVAKGDEKLMTLVEKLEELGNDSEIISIYTAADDMEMKLADAENYGEARGRAEGEKLGRAEGERLGRVEGITDTARNMLKAGIPIDKIQQCTGMSKNAVKALM